MLLWTNIEFISMAAPRRKAPAVQTSVMPNTVNSGTSLPSAQYGSASLALPLTIRQQTQISLFLPSAVYFRPVWPLVGLKFKAVAMTTN
jgi:hypothetical protein